jgi:glycosyltransferase involved in cell wall biosynthesis/GT2 family glycosyltransferase
VRIAAVVHGYPPTETAGVELVAKEQADALAARGHRVSVFARMLAPGLPEGTTRDEVVDGIPVRRVASDLGARAGFRAFEDTHVFDDAFRAFLAGERPDVVHVQHLVLLSPNLLRVARAAGAAIVLSLHDAFYVCHRLFLLDRDGRRCPGPEHGARCGPCLAGIASPEDARWRFDFMARALDLADALVAPSKALARRYVDAMPFLAGRIVVVDPGIRPLAVAAPASPSVPEGRVRFLFTGTWMPHKGLDLLVDALAGLDPARWRLTVHGAGVSGHEAYVGALRERTGGLPVTWAGPYAPGALGDVLAGADVLVLPSRCDESYSRVVREARRAGLAVVAPSAGGPAEALRHDVDALLVPPDERPALRDALARLIDEPHLLARLRAARTSIPSVEQGVARLDAVLAEAVTRARGRTSGTLPRVSVALVADGGVRGLADALAAVRAQRGPFELVEVLAVDAGSGDGTLETLARHGVRTLHAPPGAFVQARARNLAAREARGDVLVFLTQEAAPAGDDWLAPLVAALLDDPLLAGVWSRHVPRPDCPPMTWRRVAELPPFAGLAADAAPVTSVARGNEDYARRPEHHAWFSGDAAAFRRTLLLTWPFPDVAFAEDRAWARRVLEAGFRTALVPSSVILRASGGSAWHTLRRSFDHARATHDDRDRDAATLRDVWRAALRETRRDVAFWAALRHRSRLRVAARWGARAFAHHLGATGGRWLGHHARLLPEPVAGRLSLHARARAGR